MYTAATAAVAPGPALERRLEALTLKRGERIWLLALGKASLPMAAAAVGFLKKRGSAPAGGLVVAPASGTLPHPALRLTTGDHPEPGAGSLAAAKALDQVARQVPAGDQVWVLLSGGTTSLIGAPETGISAAELSSIYSFLLASGLDIAQMNRIRKRFSRWGGGKLARALAGARVRVFVVSDVIGDDLASIGSGPCVPDPTTAAEIRDILERANLWQRIPESARTLVVETQQGRRAETPKAGEQAFERVSHELIASNRLALDAAAARARQLDFSPVVIDVPIAGEAAATGAALASALLRQCGADAGGTMEHAPACLIWGGETTVTLGDKPSGLGGRCQELALAAAQVLDGAPGGTALLAAGTDGRDGPTDTAGAIVDGSTWHAVIRAGRDPARDLTAHDAYPALDAAGALLRPGLTGTNVMDVVIGVCLKPGSKDGPPT